MKLALIDSYHAHQKAGVEYPFVEKRELKPKSKKQEEESELFNTFIVIFCEGLVPQELKNYIRFFPENMVIKKNLEYLAKMPIYKRFHHNLKHFDNPGFMDFLDQLVDVDYALLIQPDASLKKRNRYALTHFHVKIDWPIADAAEDLAKWLRYIQNNLYEQGEETARNLQKKLFEYYCCHPGVGGRRTAGLIAAQLLRKLDTISTVFVSSSESRSMYKYSERGASKFFLIELNKKQVNALAQKEKMDVDTFVSNYLYPSDGRHMGISEADYTYTEHSKPPEDGKLRELKPAYNWLKIRTELLHPKINALEAPPINYRWVYSTEF